MTLSATMRDRVGKGSARTARKSGFIPAVIYGDRKKSLSINLDANTFRKLMSQPGIFSQILTIEVGDSSNSVLARDIQFHPVTDVPLHIDFLRVSEGASITVAVAVEFINHEDSPGLKGGGVLNIVRHEVEVNCPVTAIPEKLTVDLDGTIVGDSIHISAVSLPEGVEPTISDRDFTIATIAAPTIAVEPEEEVSGEDVEGEGEGEGEEAETKEDAAETNEEG
jgi:large subunit ribosomal protein L25